MASSDDEDNRKEEREEDETNQAEDGGEKKRRKRKRKRKRNKAEDKEEQEDNDEIAGKQQKETEDDKRADEVNRTVFVEGIPYNVTEQDLKDFFAQHEIRDVCECRLPVWQDSGRLRGYGHVVFDSAESQKKAIAELSGKYLQNRYLSIQAAKKPRDVNQRQGGETSNEPSKTILLQNLSYDATEEDIERALSKFGTIAKGGTRVVRNANQQSKGFAYVEFEQIESATKVMNNRIVILNRACRTDYDHGRMKGSFRTGTGRLWQKEYGKPSNYGKRARTLTKAQD